LNREARKYLGFFEKLPSFNSFLNIYTQGIEVIHALEEIEKLIRQVKRDKSKRVFVKYKFRKGAGVAGLEAPRGLLFHEYDIDRYGIVREANIITPTAQFLANLELDLKKFLQENLKKKKDRRRLIEMMVRAYDPCLTCAVH